MRSFVLSMTMVVIGFCAAPASAQDGQADVHCRVVPGSRTMLCSEIAIEGDAPRPFVLLGRTRDHYDAPPLERELVREIPRTVQGAPF